MAKVNKEYQARMDGMLFAHKIVKEQGLEALTKEIKMRNILKLDLWARKGEIEEAHNNIATNCYQTVLVTMLYTLHDAFGFGKSRLHKFKDAFDKYTEDIVNLDRWGEHYASFQEYAKFLSESYDFDFNKEMIKEIEANTDSNNPFFKRCEFSGVYDLLVANGYEDAAVFLAEKIIDSKEKKKDVKEVLSLPKYQEIRKRFNSGTLDAFYAFCFMGCEFLEDECKCTRGALLEKFLNFANKMLYKMDEEYFMEKVVYYKKKHNIDVLAELECEIDVPIQELETNL